MFRAYSRWQHRFRRKRKHQEADASSNYPCDLDCETVETVRKVKGFTMTSVERINGLCAAVRYVTSAGISGDIVECGVWRGGSMMAVAETLKQLNACYRNLHLFDTFEGMSAPTDIDISIDGQSASQQLRRQSKDVPGSVWCVSPLEEVRQNMSSTGYPAKQIFYHQGRVEETLPAEAPDKIALLRLDTDWYESTRHEMVHLFPRLVDGGVLIIDDYGHWEGARRAVDEYLATQGIALILHRLDYTGRIGVYHSSIRRIHNITSSTPYRAGDAA